MGYFDPLELGNKDFWEQGNEATIGFLREAEIKHGRVAMAGFVGYLVHAKGLTWGFPMTMQKDKWPELGEGGVAALWDNLKAGGKWQIIGFVGCLEFWRELQTYETTGKRDAHYMRGGLPGKYPDFEGPLPNLYWGLGAGKKSPGQLAKGRNAEINNGRLVPRGVLPRRVLCSRVPNAGDDRALRLLRRVQGAGLGALPHAVRLPGLRRRLHAALRGQLRAPLGRVAPTKTVSTPRFAPARRDGVLGRCQLERARLRASEL